MSRTRDFVNMIRSAGLDVIRTYQKHSSIYADVRAPNGVETSFFVLARQGAGRDDLDCLARMRRFARQNPAPTPEAVPIPEPVVTVKPKRRIVKPTTTEAAAATAAAELTPIEFYRLCEWIKGLDMAGIPSLDALTIDAMKKIGQAVSEASVREAMQATETDEPEHWNPLPEPHVVVARELAAFMKKLGEEPSPQFARLMQTIG